MIMSNGVWTDESGVASAPIPDNPKMMAETTSLLIRFYPFVMIHFI
jgi:hypothetical protein